MMRNAGAEWARISRDLQRGATGLIGAVGQLASRAGREVALLDRRRSLAGVERHRSRLLRELGEVVYEHWSQSPDSTLREARLAARLEEIAALTAERDERRREVADFSLGEHDAEQGEEQWTPSHDGQSDDDQADDDQADDDRP